MWTLVGQIAPLLVSFVTTPIVIRLIGAEGYGVIVLLVLIPQYLYFTDLGMVTASTKFGSEAYAEGDREREASIIRTAALVALILSVPVGILLSIFSDNTARLFGVPEHLVSDASIAIRFIAATPAVLFLSSIFNTPQSARLRMDLNMFAMAGSRIIGLIGVPTALYFGYGIVGAGFMLLTAGLVNLVAQVSLSYTLLPQILGTALARDSLQPMIRMGTPMAIAAIAFMGLANLEKGALSALSSVTQLAFYSVALSLSGILIFLSSSMMQSLIPAFSQLQGADARPRLTRLYGRSVRLMLICAAPVVVMLGIVAEPFFTIWAGPEFGRESTLPMYILLAGLIFGLITYTPTSAIIASGRTDVIARLYWLEVPPYALLVWLLVSRYGAAGAAAAWSLRAIAECFLQFELAKRTAGVRVANGRWPAMVVAAGVMFLPLFAYLFLGLGVEVALPLAAGCFVVYSMLIWKTVIEADEAAWIRVRFSARFGR